MISLWSVFLHLRSLEGSAETTLDSWGVSSTGAGLGGSLARGKIFSLDAIQNLIIQHESPKCTFATVGRHSLIPDPLTPK